MCFVMHSKLWSPFTGSSEYWMAMTERYLVLNFSNNSQVISGSLTFIQYCFFSTEYKNVKTINDLYNVCNLCPYIIQYCILTHAICVIMILLHSYSILCTDKSSKIFPTSSVLLNVCPLKLYFIQYIVSMMSLYVWHIRIVRSSS